MKGKERIGAKKTGAAFLALAVMLLAMPWASVSAADAYSALTVSAGNAMPSFNKYLVYDEDACVPVAEFTYSITPGAAIAATANTLAVSAGPTSGSGSGRKPSAGTVSFSAADTPASPATSAAAGDGVALNDGEAYVKKSVTINFAGVSFPKPGVYRYIITEDAVTGAGASGYRLDAQSPSGTASRKRTLDVYVADSNGSLSILNYILHDGTSAPERDQPSGGGNKSDGYVNVYETCGLEFKKEVEGSQASRDKYFRFTVDIYNAVPGTVYNVDLSNADASIPGCPNSATTVIGSSGYTQPATLTAGNDGKASGTFYLQHGQSIYIPGIAPDARYSVKENPEDYRQAPASFPANGALAGYTEKTGTDGEETIISLAGNDRIVRTSYKNTRHGTVPTGIGIPPIHWTAALTALIAAIEAALSLLAVRKKR